MHAALNQAPLIVERRIRTAHDDASEEELLDIEFASRPSPRSESVPLSLLDSSARSRLVIRLASNHGHRNDASYLVDKMYGWRGYQVAAGDTRPNCVTLVASDAAHVVATITVGFDSQAGGLSVNDLYPGEVGQLRESGARLCEFTRLAVDRNEHSRELLAMMFHVAYMYGHRIYDCSDLLIEVNPRHVRFYERMLGFRPLGEERICARVAAPAVLMWLPLHHAEEQIACLGGKGAGTGSLRSLYPLFFSPDEEEGILRRLRRAGAPSTRERHCRQTPSRSLATSLS